MSNGGGSNTSGSDVLNLGSVPRGVLPRVQAAIEDILTQLKAINSGTANLVGLDYMMQGTDDVLSNAIMEEICRRIVATVDRDSDESITYAVTAPADKTKAWQPIDPLTKLPVGQYLIWDTATSTWKSPVTQTAAYVPPRKFRGSIYAPPGQGALNLDMMDFGTTEYTYTITPTSRDEAGVYSAGMAFPDPFGWEEIGRTNSQISFYFSGIPSHTGAKGMTFDILVTEYIP